MNAEIFFMRHQQSQAEKLRQLLRTHVFPAMNCSMSKIEWTGHRGVIDIGMRYVKLLQAAIPLDRNITCSAIALEHEGYRFYIQVYCAFAYRFVRKDFQKDSELAQFFPSVAIQDKMVMVPSTLGKEFRSYFAEFSPLNPFESGCILELDTQNLEHSGQDWVSISKSFREDLLQQLRELAVTWPSAGEMGIAEMSKLLGVEDSFIRYVLHTEVVDLAAYRQMEWELQQSHVAYDRWTRLRLTVHNNSEVSLPDLLVEVKGPVKVRPSHIRIHVAAKSAEEISIAVMPENRGSFPLEIVAALPGDRLFVEYLPAYYVWLECE